LWKYPFYNVCDTNYKFSINNYTEFIYNVYTTKGRRQRGNLVYLEIGNCSTARYKQHERSRFHVRSSHCLSNVNNPGTVNMAFPFAKRPWEESRFVVRFLWWVCVKVMAYAERWQLSVAIRGTFTDGQRHWEHGGRVLTVTALPSSPPCARVLFNSQFMYLSPTQSICRVMFRGPLIMNYEGWGGEAVMKFLWRDLGGTIESLRMSVLVKCRLVPTKNGKGITVNI
jgi:hypothetical protein